MINSNSHSKLLTIAIMFWDKTGCLGKGGWFKNRHIRLAALVTEDHFQLATFGRSTSERVNHDRK